MFKLAIVVPDLDLGGGVPAVARFIKDAALRSGKFEVRMISLCMSSKSELGVRLSSPGSWLHGVMTSGGDWEGSHFISVGALFSEFEFQRLRRRKVLDDLLKDFDIIQVVCGSAACANAVVGLGKPVALQVATRIKVERRLRDLEPKSFPDWWRKIMTSIINIMDDFAMRSVDAIQVENSWMRDYAIKINAGTKSNVYYAMPGIDCVTFQPSESRLADRSNYILCVGRFDDARKNVGLLLEAYSGLSQETQEKYQLILAGAAGPGPEFWSRVKELDVEGRVHYIPKSSKQYLIGLYQAAAMFVLASDEEGLGIALLEAMACGLPVISTRCGGPEDIISDGQDGFLVPLGDAVAMTTNMQKLVSDSGLNLAMGLRARQTILERFDECLAGEKFVQIWEDLLAERELT
jgi:D-inositol-3-phosphate glycosyltransferase